MMIITGEEERMPSYLDSHPQKAGKHHGDVDERRRDGQEKRRNRNCQSFSFKLGYLMLVQKENFNLHSRFS